MRREMGDVTSPHLGPPLHATVLSFAEKTAIPTLRRKDRRSHRRRGALNSVVEDLRANAVAT